MNIHMSTKYLHVINSCYLVLITAKLEAELEEFKSGLSALYSDVHGPNTTVQTML